jgi:putative endonuclease
VVSRTVKKAREGTPTEEGASLENDDQMYFTYILKSVKDGTYYYGSTSNVEKRLKNHNAGKSRYTKGHRPYVVHYTERFSVRSEAMARERYFKTIDGYNWLKANLII